MRVLNLYAGVGGNRKLWPEWVQVTAVEYDPQIAAAYADMHPDDTTVVGDAHAYLLEHYEEFDFIWSSPPCPTHSRMQNLRVKGYGDKPKFPDGKLFEEVVFLQNWCAVPFVVENVIPYYKQWIPGAQKIGRHLYWASFPIVELPHEKQENLRKVQIPELQALHGIDLSAYKLSNRRQVLRNMVPPRVGLHIFESMMAAQVAA